MLEGSLRYLQAEKINGQPREYDVVSGTKTPSDRKYSNPPFHPASLTWERHKATRTSQTFWSCTNLYFALRTFFRRVLAHNLAAFAVIGGIWFPTTAVSKCTIPSFPSVIINLAESSVTNFRCRFTLRGGLAKGSILTNHCMENHRFDNRRPDRGSTLWVCSSNFYQQSFLFKVFTTALRLRSGPFRISAGFLFIGGIVVHDLTKSRPWRSPLQVVRVVRGVILNRSGSEGRIHVLVGDNGNFLCSLRQYDRYSPPNPVFGHPPMNRHGGIPNMVSAGGWLRDEASSCPFTDTWYATGLPFCLRIPLPHRWWRFRIGHQLIILFPCRSIPFHTNGQRPRNGLDKPRPW